MSRVGKNQPSHVDIYHINSPESQKALGVLLNLLSSCCGPSGKIHAVRNSCGGHVTFTSACSRLLSALLISRPELKLIVTSVQAHLNQLDDCGLFMACMCLHLIKSSCVYENHIPVHNSLYQSYVQIISDYLVSSECTICVRADYTDLQVLLAYVGSVLKSKSFLNFTIHDCRGFSELVVKAFVESIPAPGSERDSRFSDGIHVLSMDHRPMSCSKLVHGLLLEHSELPAVRGPIKLEIKTVPNGGENCDSDDKGADRCVRVALFTCSMSGDVEEIVDATFEVTHRQSQNVEDMVLAKMIHLCDILDGCDVGLVLCQRVIHPKVKATLRSKGILFKDRLGSQIIPYLKDLTGAQPIASVLSTAEVSELCGWVDSASHIVEGDRSFLLLTRPTSSCVVTLILCAQWEERLAELKNTVKKAFHGLWSFSKEPRLLAGGGCWQVHCSYYLRDQVLQQLPTIVEKTGCTQAQVFASLVAFRSCLHHWVTSLADNSQDVLVDCSSYHCWRVPKGERTSTPAPEISSCCCGLMSVPSGSLQDFEYLASKEECLSTVIPQQCSVKRTPPFDKPVHSEIVLDNFSAATQALEKGVFTASVVLSVGQFINDKK